ncbi:MAG: hypothetical protein ACRDI2_13910, partial [Chloroflexota bacterium]
MISGSWRSRAARITSAAWPLAGPDAPWLARSARRLLVLLPLSAVLLAGLLAPTPTSGSTLPQQPGTATAPGQPQATAGAAGERFFPETGFRLGDPATDPFADYFAARGGLLTFGYPSSRPFTLLGSRVQFFQRHVMQEQPGGVGLLNLLDEGFLAFTDFGNATIPPHDPALASAAPPPSTQDYGQEVSAFINLHVPNVWEGQPVGFLDAFLLPGILAGDTDPITQTLVGLEILGFPTSQPARDPENSSFIYQRFQRGVLHYNATTGLTQPLLLADYLKALMIGRGIPPALQAQATGSRFFLQYHPARPLWLTRPEQLPDTDLTAAFEPQEPLAGVQPFIATPPLPPPTTVPVIPIQPASTFG